ncbi:Elongin-C [Psidium guajava]|nr:Elongin-C [Psidium guajava]
MKKEDTVKLISAEGFEFVIDKKAAMVSQTIRNMLTSPGFFLCLEKRASMDILGFLPISRVILILGLNFGTGSFAETQLGEVTFPEISTTILEKICQYFHWSMQYASGKETEFHIEPELTLELMMAANYLHT